jgi:hypothetical protein
VFQSSQGSCSACLTEAEQVMSVGGAPASCAGRDPGLFSGGGADHAGVDHEGELARWAGGPGFSSEPTTGGDRRRRAGGRIDGEDAGEPRRIRPVAGKFGRRRRPYMACSFLTGGKWTGGREQGVAWVDCGGSLV